MVLGMKIYLFRHLMWECIGQSQQGKEMKFWSPLLHRCQKSHGYVWHAKDVPTFQLESLVKKIGIIRKNGLSKHGFTSAPFADMFPSACSCLTLKPYPAACSGSQQRAVWSSTLTQKPPAIPLQSQLMAFPSPSSHHSLLRAKSSLGLQSRKPLPPADVTLMQPKAKFGPQLFV